MTAIHFVGLVEMGQRIAAGEISSVALTKQMLRRAKRVDRKLHAFAFVCEEVALREAARADQMIERGRSRGPLHGVPIAVKDLCYTRGTATLAGMPLNANFKPPHDATVVKRLRDAGAVLLGKLQMTEGAFSQHHPDIKAPINPWGADLYTGVSSSGSGVATAAGLCFGSLGSDTGGSIRFPSTCNGLTGLKPTWGRVSRYGVFDLAPSLDHVGPMCRNAIDCAAMLQAIAGADANDPTASSVPVPNYLANIERPVHGMTVGVDERFNTEGVDATTRRALKACAKTLRSLGMDIRPVSLPDSSAVEREWAAHCAVETATAHRDTYPAQKERYGPALAGLIELGRRLSAMDYQSMLLNRLTYRAALETTMRDVDLLLMPALYKAAPTNSDIDNHRQQQRRSAIPPLVRFTAPTDYSGHPALTLPVGTTNAGVPFGAQFIGRQFEEDRLLRVGHAFQSATDWHRIHPVQSYP